MQFFENEYPESDESVLSGLAEFDEKVHRYYDLRNTDRPVDAFSDQIASNAVDEGVNGKTVARTPNVRASAWTARLHCLKLPACVLYFLPS